MITLTGFADEAAADLDEQMDILESEGISHLELRRVWDKGVLALTADEAAGAKERLKRRGFKVSSIGSPIGKIKITDDFAQHLLDFERAVQLAHLFETPFIRVFSFFIPQGHHPLDYRDEALRRMRQLTDIAEREGVILVHENEKDIYGDTGSRCLEIMQACESATLRFAFDPANFVQCSVLPMRDAYPLLAPYIAYIHIKDALWDSGKVVPAGQGDGQLRELIGALKESGFSGFMSIEPHLMAAGEFAGMSRSELFIVASRALKQLLNDAELAWN